jgi:branched-chain amino acid transport system substrate-binding protein
MGMSGTAKVAIFVTVVICLAAVGLHLTGDEERGSSPEPSGTVKIGAILPLSGKASQYGIWLQEALQLAVAELNRNRGANEKAIEAIYEDDQATPKLAVAAMQKLIAVDKVPVVFGSWASSSVLAQAPLANEQKVVVMAEAVSPKIRDAGDFVFRIQPDGSVYLRKLIPFVVEHTQFQRAGILYVNNDFGVDLAKTAKELLVRRGKAISTEQGFEMGETNFRTHLAVARESGAEVLFVFAYGEAGQLLKQARELRIKVPFFAAATFENPNILTVAGDAAEGVVYPHHFDPQSRDPTVEEFQRRYENAYGRPAEGFAVLAYDGMMILGKALRACGNNSVCIRDFLYNLTGYIGVSGPTSFDDHGDVLKPIMIETVRKGAFVPFDSPG